MITSLCLFEREGKKQRTIEKVKYLTKKQWEKFFTLLPFGFDVGEAI
jgi:hypothetical protein